MPEHQRKRYSFTAQGASLLACLVISAVLGTSLGTVTAAAGASAASTTTNVTLFVSTSGAATTGCASTAHACASITDGVAAAEALSGDDVTIDVAAGTYDENLLIVDTANPILTIDGAAAATTEIDGGASGPCVHLEIGTVIVENLTLSNGYGAYSGSEGGGLVNSGSLTLDSITFSGDHAGEGGAIFNSSIGTLTAHGLTITSGNSGSYGGGIYNAGTATVTSATISGFPSADEGGGVYNSGTLTLNDSTLTSDGADYGGGVDNTGSVTLKNDTLSGDTAVYGGGLYNSGTGTLTDDTLANDTASSTYGGGIFDSSDVSDTVSDSIFQAAPCSRGTGSPVITDGGYNVESDDTCFAGETSPTSRVDDSTIDLATALAANGSSGPKTLALKAASSVIGFVPSGSCTLKTDERGLHRPGLFGSTSCDPGAYEFQSTVPSQPRSPSAKAGDAKVTVKWEAPRSDGGLAVKGYEVFCASSKPVRLSGTPGAKVGASGRSASVGSLHNGTTYYCVVVARNAQGTSKPSSTVSAKPVA